MQLITIDDIGPTLAQRSVLRYKRQMISHHKLLLSSPSSGPTSNDHYILHQVFLISQHFFPPSLHRFSQNFATRRTLIIRKQPLYIYLGALKRIRGQKPFSAIFWTTHQHFAMSFDIAKKFYNFKTIAYNTDVHSLCVPNLLGGRTYSNGEPLLVKFSFTLISDKTSQFCDVTP